MSGPTEPTEEPIEPAQRSDERVAPSSGPQDAEALIAQLAGIPDALDAALAGGAAQPERASAGEPTGWSTAELVGHLSDAARMWGGRMRLVVYEDAPALSVYDQDEFVRLAAYRYMPAETLARDFRVLSEANLALLRGLRPAQWSRAGRHPQRGELTLLEIVRIEADHEAEHARQITARVANTGEQP